MNEEKELDLTFYRKQPLICPICDAEIYVEELRKGRGRIIAADIDDELRQYYKEHKKYGMVIPLIYPVIVCNECNFAVFPEDFEKIGKNAIRRLANSTDDRINKLRDLYGYIDFREQRNLYSGSASYMLATSCYSYIDPKLAPTLKKAISTLRASWLYKDLYLETREDKWGYVGQIFYAKAAYYYNEVIEKEQKGEEQLEMVKHMGPDSEKNWGYDGIKYLSALLNYKISFQEKDLEKRAMMYLEIRRIIARLFGMGKSSKDKPSAMLEKAKTLFDEIGEGVKVIEEKIGKKVST